ncbi:hypothetical protein TNCV_2420411 [Trichonephila clavipes]|nr:hypothetical protein TNCV_2420411 [Trichonephila clavipes]
MVLDPSPGINFGVAGAFEIPLIKKSLFLPPEDRPPLFRSAGKASNRKLSNKAQINTAFSFFRELQASAAFRSTASLDSNANLSISAAPNVSALDKVIQILHDPQAIQFPQITEQAL